MCDDVAPLEDIEHRAEEDLGVVEGAWPIAPHLREIIEIKVDLTGIELRDR